MNSTLRFSLFRLLRAADAFALRESYLIVACNAWPATDVTAELHAMTEDGLAAVITNDLNEHTWILTTKGNAVARSVGA